MTGTWVQSKGYNGGENGRGHSSRRRHAARGAETSGGSWQVEGVGDVQVYGAPRCERGWRAGVTERCCDNKWPLMGGGRIEEETKKDTKMAETGGMGKLE